MDIAADELLIELDRIEATFDDAVRRAGQGCAPDFERRFGAHLRSLRSMLGPDDLTVAEDAMEAAERVMNAADPEAPLRMLSMARERLGALCRRLAGGRMRSAA
ncbi:MAG TPA: hypothetical protein VFT52_07400 [Luteimonas sp.]|jgi:hypothetical protein|nr:hypothetical protein [Luteimonas sp.]